MRQTICTRRVQVVSRSERFNNKTTALAQLAGIRPRYEFHYTPSRISCRCYPLIILLVENFLSSAVVHLEGGGLH